MAYKSLTARYYIAKESEFNSNKSETIVYTDDDLVEVTSDTSLKPEIETIERKAVDCSFLKKAGLAGKETGSGTIAFELSPVDDEDSKLIKGSSLLEVAMGADVETADSGTGAVIRSNDKDQIKADLSADDDNTGNGTIGSFDWNDNKVIVEKWTIKCINNDTAGEEIWEVKGETSGTQPNAKTGEQYIKSDYISFKITAGDEDFDTDDKFYIDITESNIAYEVYEVADEETGKANLFKIGKSCGEDKSAQVGITYGCNTDDSQAIVFSGIVPNSVEMSFPVAEICTISFDVNASSFKTLSGVDVPECVGGQEIVTPFIGKEAKFAVGNVLKEAKDVKIKMENTISDRESILGQGISNKVVTQKAISGEFTITFENWDELNKFKKNESASLYVEVETGTLWKNRKRFAIHLPNIKYSSVSVEDDDGVLVNKIEFTAHIDKDKKEAILVATS